MNIAEHFSDLTWIKSTIQVEVKQAGFGPKTKQTVWPCEIGTSQDEKTAIQLIGSPDNIRGITLLAVMPPDDIETIKRNGAYAALCLAAVAPNWKGRDAWLVASMRALPQMKQELKQVTTKQNHWRILLRFHPESSTLVLKAVL